jgi:predicted Zn-dependent protease
MNMKWITTGIVSLLFTTAVWAEEGKPIGMYNLSGGNDKVITRAQGFLNAYGQIKSQLVKTDLKQAASLEAQVKALGDAAADGESFRIVFVSLADEEAHAHFSPETKLLVVNLHPLQTDDEEKFGRRVERQVMRGVFFYGGRKPCPNPQCCLWSYNEMEELDMIGRGPCPPCLILGRDALKKEGVALTDGGVVLPPPGVPAVPGK